MRNDREVTQDEVVPAVDLLDTLRPHTLEVDEHETLPMASPLPVSTAPRCLQVQTIPVAADIEEAGHMVATGIAMSQHRLIAETISDFRISECFAQLVDSSI